MTDSVLCSAAVGCASVCLSRRYSLAPLTDNHTHELCVSLTSLNCWSVSLLVTLCLSHSLPLNACPTSHLPTSTPHTHYQLTAC